MPIPLPLAAPSQPPVPSGQPVNASAVSYWEQLANKTYVSTNGKAPEILSYHGGQRPPDVRQVSPPMQSKIKTNYGIDPSLKQEDADKLIAQKWVYGQSAPEGYHYNDDGLLQKNGSVWKTVGKVAAIAAPIAATIATGGAASPWLIATIGAGAGAANAALNDAGWKGILAGAALGGVGGYAGAGGFSGAGGAATTVANQAGSEVARDMAEVAAQTGTQVAKTAATQTASQIAKNIAVKAGIGAAGGLANGGGVKGALIGAGAGAASAGVNSATATAPLAARIAAQAGTKAAIGAATSGAPGAITGAANGIGGAMATPTTADGGIDWTSLLVNTAIPAGAAIASSLASGREAGRTQQANQTVTQDTQRAANDSTYEKGLEARAALELAQQQDQRAQQNDAYKNAIRSALALNVKDATFSRPNGIPNIAVTGGLRPSALGAEGHAAADVMNKKAMNALLNGETFTGLPAVEKSGVSDLPQPSSLDTVLGITGAIGKGLSAVGAQQAQAQQSSLVQKLLAQAQQDANKPGARPTPIAAPAPITAAAPNLTPQYGTVLPNPALPSDDEFVYE